MPTKEELLGIEKLSLIENTLLKRTEFELTRKEKHSNARLISDSDYTPEKFLAAFRNSKIDCISMRDENKKNEDIPEFKLRKLYFALTWVVVYISLYTIIISRMIMVGNGDSLKELSTIIMLVAVGLFFILPTLAIASLFKYLGMPPFNAFLRGDTKFFRMGNGQIAFADLSEKGFQYPSVFENLDVVHNPKWEDARKLNYRNSGISEVYVPTKIISVKMTRNGILLESSGKFYGIRTSYVIRYGHNHAPGFHFRDWSEMDVDYRKEVIPVTWTNIEALFRAFQTYDNGIEEKPIKVD